MNTSSSSIKSLVGSHFLQVQHMHCRQTPPFAAQKHTRRYAAQARVDGHFEAQHNISCRETSTGSFRQTRPGATPSDVVQTPRDNTGCWWTETRPGAAQTDTDTHRARKGCCRINLSRGSTGLVEKDTSKDSTQTAGKICPGGSTGFCGTDASVYRQHRLL